MERSWNQKYKDSGTTLSYKEWRKREDEKMIGFITEESRPKLDTSAAFDKFKRNVDEATGKKTEVSKKTVFGLSTTALIIGGIIIVGAVAYTIYKNREK